jgi:hypothetical protein
MPFSKQETDGEIYPKPSDDLSVIFATEFTRLLLLLFKRRPGVSGWSTCQGNGMVEGILQGSAIGEVV